MASAHRYQWTRTDGTIGRGWRAKWTDAEGKPRGKRGFDRKGDAEAYAADRESEARHGLVMPGHVGSSTTVDEWSRRWLQGLSIREETRASYDFALDRILPAFGTRQLGTLRPSEIRAWRRGLRRQDGGPLADSTGDKVLAVFATILRAAVQDGLLDRTPMPPGRGLLRPQRVVDPAELLTLDQVRAWSEALPPWLSAAPLLAATTGLRQGELLGLRPGSVDFLRRQVHVSEQLRTPRGGGQPTWGPPKTAAGVRSVPLPAPAAEALARHLEVQPAVPGEPLLRTVTGRRWRQGGFQGRVLEARRAAGLPEWATFHALRDVYASSLIRQGVDVRTVMTLLGHVSAEETLRTYARLWGDATENARGLLDALWDVEGPLQGQSAQSRRSEG